MKSKVKNLDHLENAEVRKKLRKINNNEKSEMLIQIEKSMEAFVKEQLSAFYKKQQEEEFEKKLHVEMEEMKLYMNQ